MRRSTLPARLTTIVIAVIATPVGVTLLTMGGTVWLFAASRFPTAGMADPSELVGPSLLQAAGILLLVGVVATGVWSSAGLIAAGVLALVPVAFGIAPGLLMEVYKALPGEGTRQVLDSVTYGAPLFLLPALGAMGVALALLRRRRREAGAGLSVAGLLGSPVLLLVGAVTLAWGHGAGMLQALQQFDFTVDPLAVVAVIGGVVLIAAGILMARWSAFALLLPALFLLVLSALVAVPGSARWFYLPSSPELSRSGPALLLLGIGVAAALMYLAFTVTLLIVRRRTRALPGTEADAPQRPFEVGYIARPVGPTGYPPVPPAS